MSALFNGALQAFLEGGIAWLTDNIRVMLVDHSVDTPVPATDNFFSDIAAGARRGNSGGSARANMPLLGTKTSTAGVADAADVTITAITGGLTLSSAVVFRDSGADGTSRLIAFINTGPGFPFSTSGGDGILVWNASGIFTL